MTTTIPWCPRTVTGAAGIAPHTSHPGPDGCGYGCGYGPGCWG
ncbi:hypothetical protein ACPCA8_20540 [Streptomyces capoamus]